MDLTFKILIIVYLSLIVFAILANSSKAQGVYIGLGLNTFKTQDLYLGISNETTYFEDGNRTVLRLGFLFFIIEVLFESPLPNADNGVVE